ncbi:MAG: hypothetical protein JXA42_02940 [Anaerolineales bacterium]|nr:hypothetical protein [Anaerolineales bacterium]
MKFSRYFFIFIIGLMLGWLVIGWLVWPVHWINTKPSELLPEYQKVYIHLVAGDYWRDRNIGLVREALDGWDQQALAILLEQMLNEADSAEELEQLSELARVMSLPDATLSIWNMFLDPQNKILLITASFSALLLGGAITLGFSTMLRSKIQSQQEATSVDFQDDEAKQTRDGTEPSFKETVHSGDAEYGNKQVVDKDEQFEYGDDFEDEIGADTSLDSGQESDETSEDTQDEDSETSDDLDLDLDDDDEEESQSSTGALFSFFDEEESIFPELEALCKNLPDVDIDELFNLGMQVVNQFEMGLKEPY